MPPQPRKHIENIFRTLPPDPRPEGHLRLNMNENPDGLPAQFVRSVLEKVTPDLLASYPSCRELTELLARSLDFDPAGVLVTNGSDAAIKRIFEAFVAPGDRVLLTDPTFAMYPVYCELFQAERVPAPYRDLVNFPFDAFLREIGNAPKLAVIVNPNNPTGSKLEQDKIQVASERCAERGVLLIVDEAYHHYLGETSLPLARGMDNVLVLRTFSKLCGLAALRAGFALGHPDLIRRLFTVSPTFDVNGLAVLFCTELLKHPDIIEGQKKLVEEGRKYLAGALDRAGVGYHQGHGNFVLIDVGEKADSILKALEAGNVHVSGGFRQDFLRNYIRVTLGGPETMKKFMGVFLEVLKPAG